MTALPTITEAPGRLEAPGRIFDGRPRLIVDGSGKMFDRGLVMPAPMPLVGLIPTLTIGAVPVLVRRVVGTAMFDPICVGLTVLPTTTEAPGTFEILGMLMDGRPRLTEDGIGIIFDNGFVTPAPIPLVGLIPTLNIDADPVPIGRLVVPAMFGIVKVVGTMAPLVGLMTGTETIDAGKLTLEIPPNGKEGDGARPFDGAKMTEADADGRTPPIDAPRDTVGRAAPLLGTPSEAPTEICGKREVSAPEIAPAFGLFDVRGANSLFTIDVSPAGEMLVAVTG